MLRSYPRSGLVLLLGLALSASAVAQTNFTILHTNDFHGALEASASNPGAARTANVISDVRASVGSDRTLLVDAGDTFQGSFLTNLQHGVPTIAYYRAIGYQAVAVGNHDFDWGQARLGERSAQAAAPATASESPFPFLAANVVSGSCDASNWTSPAFAQPYEIVSVGGGALRVAFIGVTTTEVPSLTPASATAGLCFKDPAASIIHYYDTLASQADVVVVLSHLGFSDGGYGYGMPVYGDQTLAMKLIDAGKPVPLIIGGHSHTNLAPIGAKVITSSGKPGRTLVTQAYYAGRQVGRADFSRDAATGEWTVAWQALVVPTSGPQYPPVQDLVNSYANDPAYLALIHQPILYSQVDLLRNYNGDSMTGSLVTDAVYGSLNGDAESINDVDVFLTNPGGLRIDWCNKDGAWSSVTADCHAGVWQTAPLLLDYSQTFAILPFGNVVVVGQMTGAQIMDVLDQSATLFKGAIQPSGLRYHFTQSPEPYAHDVCIVNRTSRACEPISLTAVYKVGTIDFLFGGGDGFMGFRSMVNVTAWGDILDHVNGWAAANHGSSNPYLGPNGDGTLDGRIAQTLTGDTVPPVVTITSPLATSYTRSAAMVISFTASDPGTGVSRLEATLDGTDVTNGFVPDLQALALGSHTVTVTAWDRRENSAAKSVTFKLEVSPASLVDTAKDLYDEGQIDSKGVLTSLVAKLQAAMDLIAAGDVAGAKATLKAFIAAVRAQSGKHIAADAAAQLIADANWLIAHL
jgi:2',3'-cyclic-nucleotide 2'-phosphodiesterase (5'-nucleotidase family)